MDNKTVVLIEDDTEDIEFFSDIIKAFFPRYQCFSFTDACSALDHLKAVKQRPDVIIIDLNLRDMAAEVCMEEVRKIRLLNDSRIIIYSSAIPNAGMLNRLTTAGVDFFQKPSSMIELENRMRQMLS